MSAPAPNLSKVETLCIGKKMIRMNAFADAATE